MDAIDFAPRAQLERLRGERGLACSLAGLWCVGSLDGLTRPSVAIVGTRAATAYGRGLAHAFARDLGRAGCAIVSGLALGIDAAAHAGAIAAGAPTIGVLGGGHRRFFPKRNRDLAAQMVASGGAVLSPYPPDHPPFPSQFLARNAIVAALADALVVIEAPARSGALNTAGWAADRVPVFAVPGDVDRPHAQGCLALIRDGAILARHAGDVLEAFGASIPALAPTEAVAAITPRSDERAEPLHRAVLVALAAGEVTFDGLAAATEAAPAALQAALALLELDGAIERRGSAAFARTR